MHASSVFDVFLAPAVSPPMVILHGSWCVSLSRELTNRHLKPGAIAVAPGRLVPTPSGWRVGWPVHRDAGTRMGKKTTTL